MRVISVVLAGLAVSVSPAIGDVMLLNRIGPSASVLYIANADGSRERTFCPRPDSTTTRPSPWTPRGSCSRPNATDSDRVIFIGFVRTAPDWNG